MNRNLCPVAHFGTESAFAMPSLQQWEGSYDKSLLANLYYSMYLVRCFEQRVLELFSEGQLNGTTHVCIGQEAAEVGIVSHLEPSDLVFSNHRCHGHYLLHQHDAAGLLAELMGRNSGPSGGRGGSQHIHKGNFFSNGVQGGIAPVGVGMALAKHLAGTKAITAVFLGDGTLGEGQIYEACNIAALWQLPVLFVVEHNYWAQSTPSWRSIAGTIAGRFAAFGIPCREVTSSDVRVIHQQAGLAVAACRALGPQAFIVNTCRFCNHSKASDGRPQNWTQPWLQHDPLIIAASGLSEEVVAKLQAEVRSTLADAEAKARASQPATEAYCQPLPIPVPAAKDCSEIGQRVNESLNQALYQLMEQDPRVLVIGEDVLDPYGGAFKVTKGLSTAFPERVFTTPISEACIIGLGAGLALQGLRPVCEIMFGDFITLGLDQLINYIAKFRNMYGGKASCPIVIRTPMGGRRGYGPTHSQTLDRLLLGIPDVRVIAPSAFHAPGQLLSLAVQDEAPVVFIENKILYTQRVLGPDIRGMIGNFAVESSDQAYPCYRLSLNGFEPAQCTLAAYSGMADIARQAAEELLIEHEICCELVIPCDLGTTPALLSDSLANSQGCLVTAEEGISHAGWGSELIAVAAENGWLKKKAGRVGAKAVPIPAATQLEKQVLPGVGEIIQKVLSIVEH